MVSNWVTKKHSKANHHHHAMPIHMSYIPKNMWGYGQQVTQCGTQINTLNNFFQLGTQIRVKGNCDFPRIRSNAREQQKKKKAYLINIWTFFTVNLSKLTIRNKAVRLHCMCVTSTHQSPKRANKWDQTKKQHKSTLMLTNQSFSNFATSSFSKDSTSITWHLWNSAPKKKIKRKLKLTSNIWRRAQVVNSKIHDAMSAATEIWR
jgi:hypothetical protein